MTADARDSVDTAESLVTAVLAASRALVGVAARSLAEAEGVVTLPQYRLLVILSGHGATTLSGLADRLGVAPSTALRMVDRLVEAGFVARAANPADRREVVIDLTAPGTHLVQRVTSRRRAEVQRILQAMPPRERSRIASALRAFAAAAGEPVGPDSSAEELGW